MLLTDMHMPRMDGFTLVEEVRRRVGLEMMAIMMLTSAGHSGDAGSVADRWASRLTFSNRFGNWNSSRKC